MQANYYQQKMWALRWSWISAHKNKLSLVLIIHQNLNSLAAARPAGRVGWRDHQLGRLFDTALQARAQQRELQACELIGGSHVCLHIIKPYKEEKQLPRSSRQIAFCGHLCVAFSAKKGQYCSLYTAKPVVAAENAIIYTIKCQCGA